MQAKELEKQLGFLFKDDIPEKVKESVYVLPKTPDGKLYDINCVTTVADCTMAPKVTIHLKELEEL